MLNQGLTEEELELLLAPTPETTSSKGVIHKLSSRLRSWSIVQIVTQGQPHKKTASSPSSKQEE